MLCCMTNWMKLKLITASAVMGGWKYGWELTKLMRVGDGWRCVCLCMLGYQCTSPTYSASEVLLKCRALLLWCEEATAQSGIFCTLFSLPFFMIICFERVVPSVSTLLAMNCPRWWLAEQLRWIGTYQRIVLFAYTTVVSGRWKDGLDVIIWRWHQLVQCDAALNFVSWVYSFCIDMDSRCFCSIWHCTVINSDIYDVLWFC